MHDLYPGSRYEGEIIFNSNNILSEKTDANKLRRSIGMVFQRPCPFPMTIYENLEYGLKIQNIKDKGDRIEQALKQTGLWDEVKDRLKTQAYNLSGGQQQRLAIARALAVSPQVLLFDEPTSSLDPISTNTIEELIRNLKHTVTVIIVTHNLDQAQRISNYTGFLLKGKLIEFNKTELIFSSPARKETYDYISGTLQ
ncbi:phosphate ABC transporter ATP-binding protein [Candidatus Magnetoovum chiemensis]|nr:phosphate ABC transporter ATP-binding protein [Candidatus Magnetoovum chiemensis]